MSKLKEALAYFDEMGGDVFDHVSYEIAFDCLDSEKQRVIIDAARSVADAQPMRFSEIAKIELAPNEMLIFRVENIDREQIQDVGDFLADTPLHRRFMIIGSDVEVTKVKVYAGPLPLTVTEAGEVFGHVAGNDS